MVFDRENPTVLAIDTSGPVAGCAILKDGRIVHQIAMNHGLTHSETIMPAVDGALSAVGLTCKDVDVFAAVAGPGSFTGVRIGVCAAKGLAHGVGKPCCAVHALETLAMNFYGFDGLCCPILDARRGQVYCAAFDMANGLPVRALEDAAEPLADFLNRLPKDRPRGAGGEGADRPAPPEGPARRCRGHPRRPAPRDLGGGQEPCADLPPRTPGGARAKGEIGNEE